jgi:hypothetical protein
VNRGSACIALVFGHEESVEQKISMEGGKLQ